MNVPQGVCLFTCTDFPFAFCKATLSLSTTRTKCRTHWHPGPSPVKLESSPGRLKSYSFHFLFHCPKITQYIHYYSTNFHFLFHYPYITPILPQWVPWYIHEWDGLGLSQELLKETGACSGLVETMTLAMATLYSIMTEVSYEVVGEFVTLWDGYCCIQLDALAKAFLMASTLHTCAKQPSQSHVLSRDYNTH